MRRYCRIHIDLDKNAAFQGSKAMQNLALVLIAAAHKAATGQTYTRLLDPNGSHCGTYEIVDKTKP